MIEIAKVGDLPPPAEWKPWMVYVGRQNNRRGLKASPLANPFPIGRQWHGQVSLEDPNHNPPWHCWSVPPSLTRRDVIRLYKSYLGTAVRHRVAFMVADLDRLRALLKEHGKLVLVGGPHAEVIKEVLESAERSA